MLTIRRIRSCLPLKCLGVPPVVLETAQSWLIVVSSAVVLTTGHTSRGRSAQGHLCMKETPRNSPPSFSTFYFFTLFYSKITLSACTIKTLKKRINNYSGTSDRLSKATIRRTEYDYIYTKYVVLAPTTAPVGHVRRVPALPDFPGREMTH